MGEGIDLHGDYVGDFAGGDGAEGVAAAESDGRVERGGAEDLVGRDAGSGEQCEFFVAALWAEDAEVGAKDYGDARAICFANACDAVGVAVIDEFAGEQSGSVGGAVLFHEGDGGVVERAVLDGVGAVGDNHVKESGAADYVDGDFSVELMGGVDDGF